MDQGTSVRTAPAAHRTRIARTRPPLGIPWAGRRSSRCRWTGDAAVVAWLAVVLSFVPSPSAGQVDSVSIRPGPSYEAGPVKEWLLGSGYRPLWTSPVRVEVLDLGAFAGGLTPIEAGGGGQTRTLHMRGADGRRYLFRSVYKFVEQSLPRDLRETFLHRLFQDQLSALHPTGALIAPPLLDAAGVLGLRPRLVVMPDDVRLGEHRAEFAMMLGQIEERPNEGPDDTPGFAGSSKVVGMERLLERIEEDPSQRPAAREYLAARLVDFVIGDPDRGADQWRWASVERPGGGLLWRPVPRDRDMAFVRADGQLSRLARIVFPKLLDYGPSYAALEALTVSSVPRDRRLLSELPKEAWDSVVATLQERLTDEVIAEAVAGMPPEHQAAQAERLARALRARRAALPAAADRFYDRLAGEVDVHATTGIDVAAVDILPDGSVDVRLSSPRADPPSEPYYQRRFRPDETGEVRIYLLDGADRAVVRGHRPPAARIRVIGGPGNDVLLDSTTAAGGRVSFHDARGENVIAAGPATRVDRRPFAPPSGPEDFLAGKVMRKRFSDWGSDRSLRPVVDYGEGAGVTLGAGVQWTEYGFRRVPYALRTWVDAAYATRSGGFGVEAGIRRPRENSPWTASLVLNAEQYDAFRFYGLGNNVPEPADHDRALVMQDRIRLTPGLSITPAAGVQMAFGLQARYTDPRPHPGGPLERSGLADAGALGTVGGWVHGDLDRTTGEDAASPSGYRLMARGTIHPAAWDTPGWYGTAGLEAHGYVPAGPLTLAARAGGRKAWGTFPAQDAASIGGKRTLRGFRYQRFAGDGALYGSTELRLPVGRVPLLVHGRLGVLAFADAGRVYLEGTSPGGWHTGGGGGLSFTSLGGTISASLARGEENRVYLDVGMPF